MFSLRCNHMAIAEIVEQKAIKAYIDSNGNQTQAYLASHPNAQYNTANQNSSNFMLKHDIPNKALALASAHKRLNITSALDSLANAMDSTKPLINKGKILSIADNPVRLDATKFLLEKVYGVGKDNVNPVITNNTISVNITDMTSISKELKELTSRTKAFMDKLNNSDEI